MIRRFVVYTVAVAATVLLVAPRNLVEAQSNLAPWWQFQSVDTMKFSRDVAREKLADPSFDGTIDQQIREIAGTGATHVALATPYDDEFLPILKRWVVAARRYDLNVWFRGNWAGWEEWFGYQAITRDQHFKKTEAFIKEHPDLFEDGDIFTACPECENGGPGDPRHTGDIGGFRKFMVKEYAMTTKAFASMNRRVQSNFISMNGDVARVVMDQTTTKALDGIVTIDHYVQTPDQLVSDIQYLAQASGGRIVLGEFGAPIPDIHGNMTDAEQALWLKEALVKLAPLQELMGVSYWVNTGSSTELWKNDGAEKPAVSVLRAFFKPENLSGRVFDEDRIPVPGARVTSLARSVKTDESGIFRLPYLVKPDKVTVMSDKFLTKVVKVYPSTDSLLIPVYTEYSSLLNRIIKLIKKLLSTKIFG